jgi:hypothetical protein
MVGATPGGACATLTHMKPQTFYCAVLIAALAITPRPNARAREQDAQLVVHYPLASDLNDATGNNPPIQASNAQFQSGKGIFCNDQYARESAKGCDVRTPNLKDLNLSTLTISAQFLVPRMPIPANPVLVAGEGWRWLFYELRPGGGIRLGYNNDQFVDCSVRYRLGVWHEATITFDGETTTLYLDGVAGCRAKAAPIEDLAPVDLFLGRCPTTLQVASIDADLRLAFESDPTKSEPLACTAGAGSRDLSPMKKRVYNTLLLMRQIQFDQPLPWTGHSRALTPECFHVRLTSRRA